MHKIGKPKIETLNVTYGNEGSTVSGGDKPDSNAAKTSSYLTHGPSSSSMLS